MSSTAPATFPSPEEQRAAARRKRLFQLQRIVWELMFERYHKVTMHDYDATEDALLIEALRVCGLYIDQIEFIGLFEPMIFRIEGIDGNEYLVSFELMSSAFRLSAARVETTSLTLATQTRRHEDEGLTIYREQAGLVEEASLGDVTVDRAFLIAMSMVIGLMEPQGDNEDDRLLPLVKQIAPTTEELDSIASRLPAPIVLLDDDDPY